VPLRRDGRSLNIYRTLAHAPAALDAYLSIRKALSRGDFSPALREKLAIAISAANGCGYCVPAHTLAARRLGVPEEDITLAAAGRASDPRDDMILTLARTLAHQRGWLSDEEFERARQAGITPSEMMELVAHVAANTLSNYANHVARTDIDIP
jgi:uncharacterized peroxidase-related enzyme